MDIIDETQTMFDDKKINKIKEKISNKVNDYLNSKRLIKEFVK